MLNGLPNSSNKNNLISEDSPTTISWTNKDKLTFITLTSINVELSDSRYFPLPLKLTEILLIPLLRSFISTDAFPSVRSIVSSLPLMLKMTVPLIGFDRMSVKLMFKSAFLVVMQLLSNSNPILVLTYISAVLNSIDWLSITATIVLFLVFDVKTARPVLFIKIPFSGLNEPVNDSSLNARSNG